MVEGASRSFEAIGLKGLRFSDGGRRIGMCLPKL